GGGAPGACGALRVGLGDESGELPCPLFLVLDGDDDQLAVDSHADGRQVAGGGPDAGTALEDLEVGGVELAGGVHDLAEVLVVAVEVGDVVVAGAVEAGAGLVGTGSGAGALLGVVVGLGADFFGGVAGGAAGGG